MLFASNQWPIQRLMQLWATPQEALRLLVQAWQEHTHTNTHTIFLCLWCTHRDAVTLFKDTDDTSAHASCCAVSMSMCAFVCILFVCTVTCRQGSEAKTQHTRAALHLQGQHSQQGAGCSWICISVCVCVCSYLGFVCVLNLPVWAELWNLANRCALTIECFWALQ